MKYEWRKEEKHIYLPPQKPVLVDVPQCKYFTIRGSGNPNSPFFAECVEALYAVSYAIRMSHKKGLQPENFYEYTVYPLEGVWDLSEHAKKSFEGIVNKDELVFTLMIRQPHFVSTEFAEIAKAWAKKKTPNPHIQEMSFCEITDGKCLQMMHLGSYDNEEESFAIMNDFATKNQLTRRSMQHKEIYISDPRKVAAEKLKTVLRFKVE
ncbi:hypothetical protein CSB45_14595 [candidate division KSB3 bacterium]|uniref:GyrI-like small molecule binding domain-containing protein n=1 Tax=candidate division KSB3 bacterium TaxID=2044937 RepID=A0A2G6E105_9BACT|nr:MAG: hypothetical protein CSB45_14595 [candidate division KSB3 bacterium]PIE28430.1 MAG: hypothetical protein CSA57_14035 [candidate division KSB3 bacterium]